ncbi:adenylosuccinate synthetase [Trichonephila clavipes]|nr:adenylosuccinate synthetase [Trichonephila clavipes]
MSANGHSNPKKLRTDMPSKVSVVLGAQWGDEGKGKVVDMLACDMDIVCRCQGGNNAGHTVVVEGNEYDLHILPSGVVHNKCTSIIGNGVVINIPQFFEEIKKNEDKGLASLEGRLFISDRAHIVFDFHQTVDGLQEQEKGSKSIGTTKKGIGPTYSSKASRSGIRLADLLGDFAVFEEKFRNLLKTYMNQHASLNVDIEQEVQKYKEYANAITPFVTDTVTYLHQAIASGKKILVEGANAALLDIDFGTYPYVTSSNCTVEELVPSWNPTNCHWRDLWVWEKSCKARGHEIGVTTKRKTTRCGWLDAVLLRYSNMINGYTAVAVTKLDILDTFGELKIGVAYRLNNKRLLTPPYLPTNAKKYITTLEELAGVKGDRFYRSSPKGEEFLCRNLLQTTLLHQGEEYLLVWCEGVFTIQVSIEGDQLWYPSTDREGPTYLGQENTLSWTRQPGMGFCTHYDESRFTLESFTSDACPSGGNEAPYIINPTLLKDSYLGGGIMVWEEISFGFTLTCMYSREEL